jgi:FkbM family methyltransferase
MIKNAWTLLTHPRMLGKYSAWLATKLTGRACTASLPGGGAIRGFRRFSDYWSFTGPSPAELNLLRRVVRRDMVVADIGANVGAFTVTMARLAPSGRVLAFEPSPYTVQILRSNVEQNLLTNVEIVQSAVTDTSGQIQFTDNVFCSARSRMATGAAEASGDSIVLVDAIRLDQVCDERAIGQLDFVKTDTEGAEARVIRGAADLLRHRRIGALLVEICPAAMAEMDATVAEFLDVVESFGYAVFRLQPDGRAGERLRVIDLARITLDNVLVQPV